MKKIFFLLSFFCVNAALANKIDSLKTDVEILQFISQLYKIKYSSNNIIAFKKNDSINPFIVCNSIQQISSIKKWDKIDFNRDNKTDLFAIIYVSNDGNNEIGVYTPITIIAKGNGNFDLIEIPGYFTLFCHTAKPIYIEKQPLILYHYIETKYYYDSIYFSNPQEKFKDSIIQIEHTDTLIYKFDAFVELNTKNGYSENVKSVIVERSPSFIGEGAYKLIIFKDRTANYISDGGLNDNLVGNFRTKIKEKQFFEIFSLMNYLNITNLEDAYNVPATDFPTITLKVYFDDGSMKEIRDYGEQGTMGLRKLYNLFSDLRINQNWK